VFAQAREKACTISCLSNMKQLGLAFAQYSQDYDEYSPNGINSYSPPGSGWAAQLYPYVKSLNVYKCPDDNTPTPGAISYGYNANNAISSYSTTVDSSSYSIAQYNAPVKTVLLFEVQGNMYGSGDTWTINLPDTPANPDVYFGTGDNGASPAGYGVLTWGAATGGISGAGTWASPMSLLYSTGFLRNTQTADDVVYASPNGRHTLGSNFLMADDHAKWFRPSAVCAGITNTSSTDCNAALAQDSSGEGTMAAGTQCGDSSIAATFSLN
jgi:hypothetical protein